MNLKTEIVNFTEYLLHHRKESKKPLHIKRHATATDLALVTLELSLVYLDYKILELQRQQCRPGIAMGRCFVCEPFPFNPSVCRNCGLSLAPPVGFGVAVKGYGVPVKP